jgi:TonB family protein
MLCIRSRLKLKSTIVSGKSMQKPSHNKMHTGFISAALTAALLLASALALGQQESTLVTHFLDSNTDRVPLLTAFPTYPSIARRDRIQGQAIVCFMIKLDGRITRAKLRESTHRIFRKPVLRAIKKSTFEPLAPNQVLATAKTCRTYRFRLEPILVDNTGG